ncbi:MAG: hypothetical protein KDN22_18840 [Verrucomicrobiae bacterium]|nr:hypothetical protein [Verrucomicrobiae bacterium]
MKTPLILTRMLIWTMLTVALSGSFASGAQNAADYARQEFIILVGGPSLHRWEKFRRPQDQHDKFWSNFMSSARIRTQQLRRAHGDAAIITWLVYKRGYAERGKEDGQNHLQTIQNRARQLNVRLVWYDTSDQVINYLNKGMSRRKVKIATLDYFGHSNKFCFLLDYSNEILGASRCYLHQRDLGRVRRGIFIKEPRICSYGCHTGESMASVWQRATGTRMRGAVGKTDYSGILAGGDSLPVISSENGHWVE